MLKTIKLNLLIICVLLLACNKVEDAMNAEINAYSPDLAFTLIDSRVEAKSILETLNADANISTDADGLLALEYSGKVFEANPDSLFQLPDLSYTLTDTIINLDLVSVFLSQLDLKSGKLTYDIFWDDPRNLYIDVELTNSFHRETGEPLRFRTGVGGDEAPLIKQDFYDISDYIITPAGGGFEFKYDARTVWLNEKVIIDEFSFALEDMKFNYLEGLLSTVSYEVPADTVVFDVLQNISSGFILSLIHI